MKKDDVLLDEEELEFEEEAIKILCKAQEEKYGEIAYYSDGFDSEFNF